MKLIPTTPADLEKLKARAKVLKRRNGGTHREALNKAAQEAGYLHWHHAVECQKESQANAISGSLRFYCLSIANDALRGETHYLAFDNPACVFVANGAHWAFVLDAQSDAALIMVADGRSLDFDVDDDSWLWNSRYERLGSSLKLQLPDGLWHQVAFDEGQLDETLFEARSEAGPDVVIHDLASNEAQSLLSHVFYGEGLEPITDDVVDVLKKKGFTAESIQTAVDEGAMFSRPRGSLVYPAIGNI